MASTTALQIAVAAASTALGAAYINARFAVGQDIQQISYRRSFSHRLAERLQTLGEEATIYRTLELADREADALWFEGCTWSYAEVSNEVDHVAWSLQSKRVKSGDFVAVFMMNSPEIVFTIYAIAKLGAVSALLNATLRRDTLEYCINIADATIIISTPDLFEFLEEIQLDKESGLDCWCLDLDSFDVPSDKFNATNTINRESLLQESIPSDFVRPKRGPTDVKTLIYTSGTTAPPSKYDKTNLCIVALGNGLHKDIWNEFKERYGIPEIREVYRSTEGVAKLDNFGAGVAGAGKVGHSGPLGRFFESDTYLVKYDYNTESPYRDAKTGFCVKAKLWEPGEAIGRVRSMAFYSEYLKNPTATNLKLIYNVFQKGDRFQRTGDLLLRDTDGCVSFHDRTGDTVRWNGENVSAGEVRGFILELPNVSDAVVFGMKLEGYDGQLGAAGICLQSEGAAAEGECMNVLFAYLESKGLPSYAFPRLVRFIPQTETGATFKHAKDSVKSLPGKLSLNEQEGNRLYWLDRKVYKKLDDESWGNIEVARAKL